MHPAAYKIDLEDGLLRLNASGDWLARHLGALDGDLRAFEDDTVGREVIIDASAITRMNSSSARSAASKIPSRRLRASRGK